MPTKAAEKRKFSVHPAIIKSLIREQAHSFDKAIAELVMNSIDAGAKNVTIEYDGQAFSVADDGKGFSGREEIEQFFEVFGAPHEAGDAQYGRFRVGRGQIMAHAKVSWISGNYEMAVDLDSNEDAYALIKIEGSVPGCVVKGIRRIQEGWGRFETVTTLRSMLQYMPIPIVLNGELISIDYQSIEWDIDTDDVRVKMEKGARGMSVYDRGVYVKRLEKDAFGGRGGILITKKPLTVNMARNEIAQCDNWIAIKSSIRNYMLRRWAQVKTLNVEERIALVADLVHKRIELTQEIRDHLLRVRFIDDPFGGLKTPRQMLDPDLSGPLIFTEHDTRFSTVAERLHREKQAVVLPNWMFCDAIMDAFQTPGKFLTPEERNTCKWRVVYKLREHFGIYSDPHEFRPLSVLARDLRDTYKIVDERELTEYEKVALQCIRKVNGELYRYQKRKIVVGESDFAQAWTDGYSYIAIKRFALERMRQEGGCGFMVGLLLHEYTHGDSTVEEHPHDLSFYEEFHASMLRPDTHLIIRKLENDLLKACAEKAVKPRSVVVNMAIDAGHSAQIIRARKSKVSEADNARLAG